MAMRKHWALWASSALLLAGCGAEPLPLAPDVDYEPSPPVSLPPWPHGPQQPGVGAPGADAKAQALLAEMARATSQLRSASYTGLLYCRGSVGNKPAALKMDKGEWEVYSTYKTQFKAPGTYRVDVTKCTNPKSVGMAIYIVKDKAQVRLPGVLGLMKMSFNLQDKEMLNFRGHRLDHGSIDGLAKRLAQPPAPEARWAGEATIEGRLVDIVEIAKAPSFDKTVVKEVVGIDRQNKMPILHAMFTAQRKVYEMKMQNFRVNASISGDMSDI